MMELFVTLMLVAVAIAAMTALGKKGTYRTRAWNAWERRYPGRPPSGWFVWMYGPPPDEP